MFKKILLLCILMTSFYVSKVNALSQFPAFLYPSDAPILCGPYDQVETFLKEEGYTPITVGFGREGGQEGIRAYTKRTLPTRKLINYKSKKNFENKVIIDRTPKLYIGGKQKRPDGGYSYPIYSYNGKNFICDVARANRKDDIYYWGNSHDSLKYKANTWEGIFPYKNLKTDGYENLAPIKSFPANDFGLYGMAGNVWEWTSDWYNVNYYKELLEDTAACHNPKGPDYAYNPNNIYAQEKVIKGGSFLCNIEYCISYRISAKMSATPDTSLEHLGFRTVVSN